MHSFSYNQYKYDLDAAFKKDKKEFENKKHLINSCELIIDKMVNKYIIKQSGIVTSFGDKENKALAFVYTDHRLIKIIETWIKDTINYEPQKYRLVILSASVFLQFLTSKNWLSSMELETFYKQHSIEKLNSK